VCLRDPEALAIGLERALRRQTPTTGRVDITHLERSLVARQVIAVYEDAIGGVAREDTLSEPPKESRHVSTA
jgi:hypothetical protein